MFKLITKVFGDPNTKELNRISKLVDKINAKEEEYQQTLQDEDIIRKTNEFKERIRNGETLDDLLIEAYALVKNACRRLIGDKWNVRENEVEWNMIPFDVQLVGAIVMHEGKIAEMKTGEGKTSYAVSPTATLNALSGKGVHVVTVNDYLSRRDAGWIGSVYNALGLSVGVIVHEAAYTFDENFSNEDFSAQGGSNSIGWLLPELVCLASST